MPRSSFYTCNRCGAMLPFVVEGQELDRDYRQIHVDWHAAQDRAGEVARWARFAGLIVGVGLVFPSGALVLHIANVRAAGLPW